MALVSRTGRQLTMRLLPSIATMLSGGVQSAANGANRITHFEQASVCPHGPYAVHSRGSAHTAQQSSMRPAECCQQRTQMNIKLARPLNHQVIHLCMTTPEPVLVVLCPEPSARIHFRHMHRIVTVYEMCAIDAL